MVQAKHGDSEPLFGLVNNAGGMSESPRGIVDLNTYGLRRVCEAFLPLIQKEKCSLDLLFNLFYIVGAAPMFVAKCSEKIQAFLVNKNVTWQEIEATVITPFIKIYEDASLDEEQKSSSSC